MNKQRLQDIAVDTKSANDNDIAEIRQLIGNFPFYYLPHVVLAKIFFEKEHYLFENALTQAAMRVSDRERLFHYIHGDQKYVPVKNGHNGSLMNDPNVGVGDVIPEADVEEAVKREEASAEEVKETEDLHVEESIKTEETEVEEIKETDEADVEEVTIDEVPKVEEVNLELIAFNETHAIEEEKVEETEVPVIEAVPEITHNEEKPAQGNDISSFLEEFAEDNKDIIDVEGENASEEAEIYENEETVTNEIKGDQAEVSLTAEVEGEEENEESPEEDLAFLNSALNLRKHPVYNVEEFLQAEKDKGDTGSGKDFFYWLQHPAPQELQAEEEPVEIVRDESRLTIIDQFIKSNPGISRPKKEFFNAENMARKSEHLDIDFVTETLANIYYEQGNMDLAIKAYEKLSLQNPLKQAYFASLIEKIKKEKR